MTWGIYLITNNINDKKYVGISNDLDRRQKEHWRGHNHNKHLQNAVAKYGIENFDFFILVESYPNKKLVADLEENYIAKWQLDNPKYGYNKTKGGEHNIPNDETRQKQSQKKKEQWADPNSTYNSDEWSRKNKNNHWSNHPTKKRKTLQKISNARKGKLLQYATIHKKGLTKYGKQRWALRNQGKIIKISTNREKLEFIKDEINHY